MRGHNTYSLHITPTRPAARAGGKRDDRDRMGAGSSQRMAAGKSWAVPSAATEGGAAVAVAEEAAYNCRESRERASTRPLLTPGAGEIAQSGPHHPTRPERLADPERRATRGSSHVAVRGGARCLRSHQARPSRTALLLRKGYMDVCTMQQQAVRTQHTSTGGMRMRMHRRQAVGGKRRQ